MVDVATPGMQMNRMLDQLGLPDVFGDMMGAMLDAKVGNQYGVMRNLLDAYSGLATSTFDQLFGQSISPFGFSPRPHVHWERHVSYHKHTYNQTKNLKGTVTANEIKQFINAPEIFGIKSAIAKGIAKDPGKIEKLIKTNPEFKAYMEAKLGGKIMWDPINGGIVTLKKTAWVPHTEWRAKIHHHAGGFLGRITGQFAQALDNLRNMITGPLGDIGQGLLNALQGGTQGAQGGAAAGGAGGASGDTAAILNNPNLSIEDKLALLLAKFAEKKMKELEDKIKEMQGGGAEGAKGKKGKGGGLFGGIGKMFGGLVGGIAKLGGGILGGMFGGPLGAMAGQGIGGMVGNILGGAGGAGGTGGGKKSETMLQSEIQLLQQKLQRSMELLSNLMKSFHDAMSTSIRNIR